MMGDVIHANGYALGLANQTAAEYRGVNQ
jgi:hypothetical protein